MTADPARATLIDGKAFAAGLVERVAAASARLEGAVQRVLSASEDGFLREVHVRPGDLVKAGQVLAELSDYLRGRKHGAVTAILREECLALGMPPETLLAATSPADGAAQILRRVQPGDLALLLVHSERAAIFQMLGA